MVEKSKLGIGVFAVGMYFIGIMSIVALVLLFLILGVKALKLQDVNLGKLNSFVEEHVDE